MTYYNMRTEAVMSVSSKIKTNTSGSTETEMVGVGENLPKSVSGSIILEKLN